MTSKEMGQYKCRNCVNFLIDDDNDNKVECDWEYFEPTVYEDAILFVPELFECNKYEDIRNL